MKQQDIEAILTQAAQLRANLCIAIEKSLQTHFHNLPISSAAAHELENGEDGDGYDALPISSVTAASAASEARSLASIRDALEVLEEQLECLQYLPDQQKAERHATLAELEESRGILIRRLKQHQGRELAVIKEALSFAGEPKEADKFRVQRSYTLPERVGESDCSDDDVSVGMDMYRRKQHRDGNALSFNDKNRPSCGLFGGLKSKLLTFFNKRLARVSGKCLFAVTGAAVVLTLSNVAYGNNKCRKKLPSSNGRRMCPKNWTPVQSGGQRCMLMEPFIEES